MSADLSKLWWAWVNARENGDTNADRLYAEFYQAVLRDMERQAQQKPPPLEKVA